MLATATTNCPSGPRCLLEAKYDGFRLLLETRAGGRVFAWSRHGTSLSSRLEQLLAPVVEHLGHGWVFDGELIALGDCDGRPVQDFAAVGRAVFGGDQDAIDRLHYVAFDVLVAGEIGDVRSWPWSERTALLAERFPASRRLRVVSPMPAAPSAHERLVSLGFEGSVLKHASSRYRPGRSWMWRKLKARHAVDATIQHLDRDHDGRLFARCVLGDGRPCTAAVLNGAVTADAPATIFYSRVDANGRLREPGSRRRLASARQPPGLAIPHRRIDATGVGDVASQTPHPSDQLVIKAARAWILHRHGFGPSRRHGGDRRRIPTPCLSRRGATRRRFR